ncbi:MAG: hypothetical protein K5697_11045 [Lachnospiraceae bacterium]|nr:hypothetical protein [Lachnospiraceae bacterium]
MNTEKAYNSRVGFWLRVILTGLLVLVALAAGFFVFRMHSEGRIALREAKNVKLALMTADIEAYGAGTTIYAPEKSDGLAGGVMEKVEKYAGVSEGVTLLEYDRKTREIRQFTCKSPHYLVSYSYDGSEELWTVDYLWRIFVY